MRIIGIMLLSFFIFIGNVSAMDMSLQQEKMCNTIAESMDKNPELWIIKSYELIYASDSDTIDDLKEISWPENDTAAELVIQYNLYPQLIYIQIEKPFEMKFKGKYRDKLITSVKKMIYKQLRDEVGNAVAHEEKAKQIKEKETPVKPKSIVESTITDDGFNRL